MERLRWDRIRSLVPFLVNRSKIPTPGEEQKFIRLNRNVDGPKRRPMQDGKVILPWYSLWRPRNWMTLSCLLVGWMYFSPFELVYKSFRKGHLLEEERLKFIKQLDEEDKVWESKVMARRQQIKDQAKELAKS